MDIRGEVAETSTAFSEGGQSISLGWICPLNRHHNRVALSERTRHIGLERFRAALMGVGRLHLLANSYCGFVLRHRS